MTKQELIRQEEEFLNVANQILKEANTRGVTLRMLGAIAFRVHCPKFKHLEYNLERELSDIDFAGYRKDVAEIEKIFLKLGYTQNQNVKYLFGIDRRIFYHPNGLLHSDVFLDKLKFCHYIGLKERLHIDSPTIPLADLLLEKLQIVQMNQKDIIDAIILMREHPVGDNDKETINIDYVSDLCSRNWPLWRTVTISLQKIRQYLNRFLPNGKDVDDVTDKLDNMIAKINEKNKTLRWKFRSLLGERIRWYREVEEINRD